MGSSSRVTIGYKYYIGMHMVICHGPVDEVKSIIVGERVAFNGSVTANQSIFIDKENLFGGEKKEGGIRGTVDIMLGGSTQGRNGYLQGQLGTDIPAFRGVVSLVLRQVYVTAMTRYPKPWAVTLRRFAAKGWYDTKASIVGGGGIPSGSTTGAHIIYEAITNPDWGMGFNPGTINDITFKASADVLFNEDFGLSLIFNRQTSVEEFIVTILSHIGAILYTNRTTSKYELKLIREPSVDDVTNAKVFTDANITEHTSFERPSPAETINEVIIVFRPQGKIKNSSVTMQDMGSVETQGGLISQTISYPGIDNAIIAGRIGARDLTQYSTPLAKVTFETGRDGWDVNPGDIISYQNLELGIQNIILRVFSVDYGTLKRGVISIDATQDIFSLPSSAYLTGQASQWVEPIVDPTAVPSFRLYELMYYDIATNYSEGERAAFDGTTCFLQVLAENTVAPSASYQLWLAPTDTEADYRFSLDGIYSSSVVLDADLPKPTAENAPIVVSFTGGKGLYFDVEIGTYCYLGTEVVEIVGMDTNTNTVTLKRAILDSLPEDHLAGTILYFAEGQDAQSATSYIADPVTGIGETVFARLLPQTDIALFDISAATADSLSFVGRQARPLPPARFTIEDAFYPIARGDNNSTTSFGWFSRNRKLQITKPFNSFYQGASGNSLNSATIYEIRVFDGRDRQIFSDDIAANVGFSNLNSGGLTRDVEQGIAGGTIAGNQIYMRRTNTGGVSTGYTGQLSENATADVLLPQTGMIWAEKTYSEFNTDNDKFYVGVTNSGLGTPGDPGGAGGHVPTATPTNTAYLQVPTNTLIGQITGVIGTGAISGGWGAIAVDRIAKKFWLRNINGTWRDGDPALGTGGFDYSTLLTSQADNEYYIPAIANEVITAPFAVTNVVWNFGQEGFRHAVPSGFVAYRPAPIPKTIVTTAISGPLVTVDPIDDLTVSFASGAWSTATATTQMTAATGQRKFFQVIPEVITITSLERMFVGVQSSTALTNNFINSVGSAAYGNLGQIRVSGVTVDTIEGYTNNDVVGVSLDMVAGTIQFWKNYAKVGSVYSVSFSTILVAAASALQDPMIPSRLRFDFSFLPDIQMTMVGAIPLHTDTLDIRHNGNDIVNYPGTLKVTCRTVETRPIVEGGSPDVEIPSFQTFEHTWDRSGYGYNYGLYYGGGNY